MAAMATPLPITSPSAGRMGPSCAEEREETVCRHVESYLRVPALHSDISPEPSSSDEELVLKTRNQLKLGRDRIGAMVVKRRITWPHKVI